VLKHLGITAPNRSTLSYANEHRPWDLYQKETFAQILWLFALSIIQKPIYSKITC